VRFYRFRKKSFDSIEFIAVPSNAATVTEELSNVANTGKTAVTLQGM
jgi:hypothetical protein